MNTTDLSTLTPEQKRALLEKLLEEKRTQGDAQSFPLSFAQQRLWFIDRLQPATTVYSIPVAVHMRGQLDRARLSDCLGVIVARHESLRTRFTTRDGAPLQVIDPPALFSLACEDLPAGMSGLEGRLQSLVEEPFDLEHDALIRCRLFALDPDEHVLTLIVHHIIADYWSVQVLIQELAQLYGCSGEPASAALPPLPIQYPDYAVWQQQRSEELAAQLDYWRHQLMDAPELLQLPMDFQRPAIQSFDGARHNFCLDPDVSSAITQIARERGMTPFMVLLAAFQLLLHRYSGEDDICVGSTVSNRDRTEIRNLIGLFVNNLVLRTRLMATDTFDTLLARVRQTVLDALAHQEIPFEQVVDTLDIERNLSHNALFQTMFVLHNTEKQHFAVSGLELSTVDFDNRSARFDLSLDMYEGEIFRGVFEYNTDIFRATTISRLSEHFTYLLKTLTADSARPLHSIDLLGIEDRRALANANSTAAAIPDLDVATLFENRAAERGDAVALLCAGRELTYSQLNSAANRLAVHISRHLPDGARNPHIAICLPRSEELAVALLAVLKLGAAYIPLDPSHPASRLHDTLIDGEAVLMLVREAASTLPALADDPPCPMIDLATAEAAIDAEPDRNPKRRCTPDDLAYVIFTSGSTGKPKGVPVRQNSLVNLLTSMARSPGMTYEDVFVAVTTPAFDIATLELLMPLLVGGRLIVAEPHTVYDDMALTKLLVESGATLMQATPATWRLLVDAGWQAPRGFKILCGGEALDPLLAKRLLSGGGELWNLYGPTETTIWSACTRIGRQHTDRSIIPIGDPIANTQLHVLDHHLQPVPTGVAGELYIGGIGLSPGYLNRGDLTAAAFVPNPLRTAEGPEHSAHLYRTGDSVRRLEDGSLIYLGRLDFQIKLRGFRIELAEIEAALNDRSEIEQAIVLLWRDSEAEDDGELVAYCRPSTDCRPDLEAHLRSALAARLPTYMVPTAFVFLDAFPLNANGKIDRKRLPRVEQRAPSDDYVQPRTSTETLVADLWREILNLPRIGREDNFFDLGGHSLLAARMITRLRPIFETSLSLRTLFEKPCLKDFCTALDAADMQDGSQQTHHMAKIPLLPRGGPLPVSFAQQRQWALAQLEPESPFYNIPGAVRLTGEPDFARLACAFELLCDRHEVLRSHFITVDGQTMASIQPRVGLSLDVDTVPQEALESALLAEARKPIDLAEPPVFRVRLFSCEKGKYVLLLILHHIIADALSVTLLIRDLAQIYKDLEQNQEQVSSLPPLPVQYADFAAWQRAQDTGDQLEYWRENLKGAPPLLELPTDFPRPANQGFDGDSVRFTIDPATTDALRALSSGANATPFMAVLAAFANVLSRYSDMDDIVIGTPVAQRPHADLEGLIGMFVNTLALRLRCDGGDAFEDLLGRARDTVLEAFANQDVPFEQVIDALSLPRNWSHTPLFQAMFIWQTEEREAIVRPEGFGWEPLSLPHRSAKTDISLVVRDTHNSLACKIEFRTDLFQRETIVCMAEAFTALIGAVTDKPDTRLLELSKLPASQRRKIRAWNTTERAYPENPECLHQLVEASAALNPDAISVTDSNGSITYRDLEHRANLLADRLRLMGVGRGQTVGINMPRRIDLVCAILAVLKTGAAYVPLDPSYPGERIAFIAEDADLAVLLNQGNETPLTTAQQLDPNTVWSGAPDSCVQITNSVPSPRCSPGGTDLAYIVYTSGSTGRPKGVALEHRNAVAFVHWCLEVFSADQLSGVLASTSVCFDLSIFEIFATLAAGGRILLVNDLFDLPEASFADEVTLINTVPTPMAELLRLGALPAGATTVCLCGEVLPASLVESIHAGGTVKTLYNLYGPSEDTTFSTGEMIPSAGVPFGIGDPITNTQAHVLDDQLLEVPIGMPGELYLSGAGIARGYWRRPDITAERFLPNPYAGPRENTVLYRTGDRVRRLHDGTLDYLSRCDRQMKIRGFRIEPGEVEAVLLQHPDVSGAVVDLWRDAAGNARLAAWLEADPMPAIDTVTAYLRRHLPEHFVPTLFVALSELPLLPNGKLDRKALPDPLTSGPEEAGARPLRDGIEKNLASIWCAVLGRGGIGREDNFFALGGDSILAIQVVAQARQAGMALLPRDIFQHPTLATLAEAAADRGPAASRRGPISGAVPLGPMQSWFLERDLPQAQHWNQGVMLKPARPLDADRLEAALAALAAQHDALRARYTTGLQGWQQQYLEVGDTPTLHRIDLSGRDTKTAVAETAEALHASFDLADGPVWGAALMDLGEAEQRLAISAHHLIVDGLSWRIMLTDLQAHYLALESGAPTPDAARSNAFGEWVTRLSQSDTFDDEAAYWRSICSVAVTPLPLDYPRGKNLVAKSATVKRSLNVTTTRRLLQEVPSRYPVQVNDLLLGALALAVRDWSGQEKLRIELESHGRPDVFQDIDLSRTVGWLTALYPVSLEAGYDAGPGEVLLSTKEILRRIPHDGVGYGVLRYLRGFDLPHTDDPVQLRFNYLGQTDSLFAADALFVRAGEPAGQTLAAENPRDTILDVNALVAGGKLHVHWTYGTKLHRRKTIMALAIGFFEHLTALIDHCVTAEDAGHTPADFPQMDFSQGELDDLLRSL